MFIAFQLSSQSPSEVLLRALHQPKHQAILAAVRSFVFSPLPFPAKSVTASLPLPAVELAMIMDRLYGGVCYAGIDTDPELKYPKGAGRVAFSNQQSYIAAISARFVQLQHGEIDKRVSGEQLLSSCQHRPLFHFHHGISFNRLHSYG